MLKAIAFIFAVWVALTLLGNASPAVHLNMDGLEIGGFAGGLLAVGAAFAAAVLVMAVMVALFLGLIVVAIGVPILLVAVVLCAVFAPVLLPFVILMAVLIWFFCALDGLFA